MTRARTALIWERFGPYHHARAEAAAARLDLHAIEVVTRDKTYAWDNTEARPGYSMHRLDGASIIETLDRINPQVVAVPGWAASHSLEAIAWARRNSARIVLMSDSNAHDVPRKPLIEWLKRGVVSQAQAGLVAGTTAGSYLAILGMDPARICLGYDVVDNAHFARPRGKAPERGFLTVARFVEKKNLTTLITAYAAYRANAGSDPWPLVIAGDGPLRSALEAQIAELGLANAVTLPGFVQYPALPELYQSAGALVLPSKVEQWGLTVNEAMAASLPVLVSNVAGCARDLVVPGETGFTFSPDDVAGLADAMAALAANSGAAAKMGTKAFSHVNGWSVEAFADGLDRAVEISLAAAPPRGSALRLHALRLSGMA